MQHTTRVLRLRPKNKHAATLREQACAVNFLWNYCNELSTKVWERERRFMSGFDFHPFTKGAGKAGLDLHSTTIQAVAEEYATRRAQARKVKLRWRVSGGPRRSLGRIPFKASALRYRNGQLFNGRTALSLWDSCGLGSRELGAGNFSEDARGRWYINICVKLPRLHGPVHIGATKSVGIDLGLKDFAALSDGHVVSAKRHYRTYEAELAKT